MFPTRLKGARTHNLKGIDLELRPGEVVVFAGVSGAGKSSLALDTLYAEGQRRFVESFSPYARQFLERLERPPMDSLDPVAAGVAVDRRAPVKSSRSTVATMADLEPYLAALFAREALPACPEHGLDAEWLDAPGAAKRALAALPGERVLVGYPLRAHDTESYLELREELSRDGFRRLLVDGEVGNIDSLPPSAVLGARNEPQVVVDRVKVGAEENQRLIADLELAWGRGDGAACLTSAAGPKGLPRKGSRDPLLLRQGLGCPECGRSLDPPTARLFSYESPLGACEDCRGFGRTIGIDFEKVIPDPSRTLKKGAIRPWRSGKSTTWERRQLRELCERHDIPLEVPWEKLSAEQQRLVLEGDGSWAGGKFPGVRGWFRWLETKAYKMHVRVLLARYRSYDLCAKCHGARLNAVALSYHVGGLNLAEWHGLEIHRARHQLDELKTRSKQGELARTELVTRLQYLERVGLGYLTLERQARTLSGGEAQRVTLTAALGTSLHNALFVLDEPTVGLHASDVERLCGMFRELADRGNLVVIVEHDPMVLRNADRIVELGPGSGAQGGMIVADGSPETLLAMDTATARALRPAPVGKRADASGEPTSRKGREARKARGKLRVGGARAHNLDGIDAEIPLGVVTAVTGPSGSGKSTLAVGIVYRALARHLGSFDNPQPGDHDRITGLGPVKSVELVDQSPLGRTSRGNAATYTGAWNRIRALFAAEPAAAARDFGPAHFSFNVDGGRCDACAGEGAETVEMQFLADVRLSCPVCHGRRFKDSVLEVRHRGLTIADVLELSVAEVLERFAKETDIVRKLGPLQRLGLGYLTIGQPLSTLSGGEAQRLKLARALSRVESGALFVLDEPSAGLHADEVAHLLSCLDAIVLAGGSVLVVEHDLDVIRAADWVIDLGPQAGASGGRIVAAGTPAEVAKADTLTGRALRKQARPSSRSVKAHPCAQVLKVERAREHNLREVSVTIPHGALTVVTGPSGSGKSTLAFDVIFAEGQRRFLETLTPYARQFLPTMPRADVDHVTGVPPSIALEQRTARSGAQSTVATVTEVAHYLRLLFAKLGTPHCPDHDEPIATTTADAILKRLRARRGKFTLLAPAIQARKGTYLDLFTSAAREGIIDARCDGEAASTDDPPKLARHREHTIELVIARDLRPSDMDETLLRRALAWGHGSVRIQGKGADVANEELLSIRSACPVCAFSVPDLDPRWFSFNTKQGRCETCEGEGWLSPDKPRRRRRRKKAATKKAVRKKKSGVDVPTAAPIRTLCPDCEGKRLAPVPRAVRLHEDGYQDVVSLSVGGALAKAKSWRFAGDEKRVADPILKELKRRLEFLCDVGLDYLHLDRAAKTLSGGEMQRLRLAAQLGAGLTGALYVLDEPTIGLHPSDTDRLLRNLRGLVDIGSTVVVVEHDLDTIRAADYLLDLGPSGGAGGGKLLASGTPTEVLRSRRSTTAKALREPPQLRKRRPIAKGHERLTLEGASLHNLRDVTLELPLNRFTVVAGVSGSGKSTLVRQVLLPALRQQLGLVADEPGPHRALGGIGALKRAVAVDQSPIGRTPRSVPATFLGIWDEIRALFAATPEARMRGFGPARFSFNTPRGGRCALCDGQGVITHEMSFLPDVVTPCAACAGQRFESATLAVRYLGLTIGDVLDLTAERGAEVFTNHRRIAHPLQTLTDLGAGYIHLGQGSHTLSGGEAQRLKLAAELTATVRHEPTLYVLDEPTTGLHIRDVSRLMNVLDRLVERGDTLAVIEHHPEVIAGADWIVELGPGGGERGGRIIATGEPQRVAKRKTPTSEVVRRVLASTGA